LADAVDDYSAGGAAITISATWRRVSCQHTEELCSASACSLTWFDIVAQLKFTFLLEDVDVLVFDDRRASCYSVLQGDPKKQATTE